MKELVVFLHLLNDTAKSEVEASNIEEDSQLAFNLLTMVIKLITVVVQTNKMLGHVVQASWEKLEDELKAHVKTILDSEQQYGNKANPYYGLFKFYKNIYGKAFQETSHNEEDTPDISSHIAKFIIEQLKILCRELDSTEKKPEKVPVTHASKEYLVNLLFCLEFFINLEKNTEWVKASQRVSSNNIVDEIALRESLFKKIIANNRTKELGAIDISNTCEHARELKKAVITIKNKARKRIKRSTLSITKSDIQMLNHNFQSLSGKLLNKNVQKQLIDFFTDPPENASADKISHRTQVAEATISLGFFAGHDVDNNSSGVGNSGFEESDKVNLLNENGEYNSIGAKLAHALQHHRNSIDEIQTAFNAIGEKYAVEVEGQPIGDSYVKAYKLGQEHKKIRVEIEAKLKASLLENGFSAESPTSYQPTQSEVRLLCQLKLLKGSNSHSKALDDDFIAFFRNNKKLPLTRHSIFGTVFATRVNFDQSLEITNVELDRRHNCIIQAWFPVPEESRSYLNEKPLNPRIQAFLRAEPHLQQKAFDRFMKFLGLKREVDGCTLDGRPRYVISRITNDDTPKPAANETFEARKHVWLTPNNPNFSRIDRILCSLYHNGNEQLVAAFLDVLSRIHDEEISPSDEKHKGAPKASKKENSFKVSFAKLLFDWENKFRLEKDDRRAKLTIENEEEEEEEEYLIQTDLASTERATNENSSQNFHKPIFTKWRWTTYSCHFPSTHISYRQNSNAAGSLNLTKFILKVNNAPVSGDADLSHSGASEATETNHSGTEESNTKIGDKIKASYKAVIDTFTDVIVEEKNIIKEKQKAQNEKRSNGRGQSASANSENTTEQIDDPHIDRLELMLILMKLKFQAEYYLSTRINRVNKTQLHQRNSFFSCSTARNNAELAQGLSKGLTGLFDELNNISREEITEAIVMDYLYKLQDLLQTTKKHHRNSITDHLGLSASVLKNTVLANGFEHVENFIEERKEDKTGCSTLRTCTK